MLPPPRNLATSCAETTRPFETLGSKPEQPQSESTVRTKKKEGTFIMWPNSWLQCVVKTDRCDMVASYVITPQHSQAMGEVGNHPQL